MKALVKFWIYNDLNVIYQTFYARSIAKVPNITQNYIEHCRRKPVLHKNVPENNVTRVYGWLLISNKGTLDGFYSISQKIYSLP